jgi:hypothetical protein
MMRPNLNCFSPLASLVCVSGAFGQVNSVFYVATTANDSNEGTYVSRWRTVQEARMPLARAVRSTCGVGFHQELLTALNSRNTSDGFITFWNHPGETAILDRALSSLAKARGVLMFRTHDVATLAARLEG